MFTTAEFIKADVSSNAVQNIVVQNTWQNMAGIDYHFGDWSIAEHLLHWETLIDQQRSFVNAIANLKRDMST